MLASESASGSITVPVILCDTLMELLDCAMDLIEEENSFDSHSNNDIVIDSFEKAKSTATVLAYSNFVTVAKAVLPIMNVENR